MTWGKEERERVVSRGISLRDGKGCTWKWGESWERQHFLHMRLIMKKKVVQTGSELKFVLGTLSVKS